MICAQCTEDIVSAELCPSCGKGPALEGKYRLESVVGHGATGTTYRATRLVDGEVFAIKELLVRKVESLKAVDLFQREVRVLGELDHAGVPDFVEELHVDAGRSVALYLVQEFVDGRTVADEFEERRATEAEVFELAAELLDTLAYLHELRPPVIHRDIKPSNVMRRASDGKLVLIDFGSVRDAVDTAEGGSTVAGTFGYMAPEQFVGRALPATDIYGVGATIVALMGRKDPQDFVGANRTIEWRGKLGLSAPFARILGSMLTESPENRADDASALASQIRAVLRGEHVPASSPASTALVPVPPVPRELPENFRKRYVPSASFSGLFAMIFLSVGAVAAVMPAVLGLALGEPVVLLMGVLFGAIFGGIGGAAGLHSWTRMKRAKNAYRNGTATRALITRIDLSNHEVNERAATAYHYEFAVDGQIFTAKYLTWDLLELEVGSDVTVLYNPEDPDQNLLFEPEQYHVRNRLRAELLASDEGSDVVFDMDDEDVESAPAEVEQSA